MTMTRRGSGDSLVLSKHFSHDHEDKTAMSQRQFILGRSCYETMSLRNRVIRHFCNLKESSLHNALTGIEGRILKDADTYELLNVIF